MGATQGLGVLLALVYLGICIYLVVLATRVVAAFERIAEKYQPPPR